MTSVGPRQFDNLLQFARWLLPACLLLLTSDVNAGFVHCDSPLAQELAGKSERPDLSISSMSTATFSVEAPREQAPVRQVEEPDDLRLAAGLDGTGTTTSSTSPPDSSGPPPASLETASSDPPPVCSRHDLLHSVLSSQMFPSGIFRPPRFV